MHEGARSQDRAPCVRRVQPCLHRGWAVSRGSSPDDRGSTVARVARHARRRRKSPDSAIGVGATKAASTRTCGSPNPREVRCRRARLVRPACRRARTRTRHARRFPLAAMLMLGEHAWQRIDGMGLARQALETPVTGDPRVDLSEDERFLLANGRAWCLVVHSDLGHGGRRDDPDRPQGRPAPRRARPERGGA